MKAHFRKGWRCRFGVHVWRQWGYLPVKCARCGTYKEPSW